MFSKFESIDYVFIILWLVHLNLCHADIANLSRGATTGLVYNLHHIAISMLHQIEEEHRIVGYDQEASTSHGPSIGPPMSSTPVRMQPIRGRGRGRVDRRGRGRDGGRGHGQDGEGGRGTPESTLPTSIPPPPSPPILTLHPRFLCPHGLTHHLSYPQTLTHLYHIRCQASLHSSRYHFIIPPIIISYIASHR